MFVREAELLAREDLSSARGVATEWILWERVSIGPNATGLEVVGAPPSASAGPLA